MIWVRSVSTPPPLTREAVGLIPFARLSSFGTCRRYAGGGRATWCDSDNTNSIGGASQPQLGATLGAEGHQRSTPHHSGCGSPAPRKRPSLFGQAALGPTDPKTHRAGRRERRALATWPRIGPGGSTWKQPSRHASHGELIARELSRGCFMFEEGVVLHRARSPFVDASRTSEVSIDFVMSELMP